MRDFVFRVCLGLLSPTNAYPGSRLWNDVNRECSPAPSPLDSRGESATPRSPAWPADSGRSRSPEAVAPPLENESTPAPQAVYCSDLYVPGVSREARCIPVRTLITSQLGGLFVPASALFFLWPELASGLRAGAG